MTIFTPTPTDLEIEEAITWRHTLHRMPELAFEEHLTSAFVAERLSSFGLEVSTGLGGTGVVGTLRRGISKRAIGLRADMDALPITEATGLTYASTHPGKMHACGHDGHTAMLLAAARHLSTRDDFDGIIHFVFQPAEENEGGARHMVEDGLFQVHPMEAIFGIHNWPALPVGQVGVIAGPMMAAFGIFNITIRGKGSHAAMPHQGVDPLACAFQIGSALQTIVARNVSPMSPAVVSVTTVHGGDAWNVIPESCKLTGTARWFEPVVGDLLEANLKRVVTSIAEALGCTVDIDYQRRYPATINNPTEARFVQNVVRGSDCGLVLAEDIQPSMAAEDFAFMLEKCPGTYIWLGAGCAGDNPGLHSPHYDFNDKILPLGVALWVSIALERLRAL